MGSSFKTETINLPTLGHVDVRVTQGWKKYNCKILQYYVMYFRTQLISKKYIEILIAILLHQNSNTYCNTFASK